MSTQTNCPYCSRPLSGDICSAHGYVGKQAPDTSGFIPKGGIIMWSGATTAIPQGWALCDGSNGTPNLRDRFIVGAGSTYAVAATGGSNAAHSHSVSVGNHAQATSSLGGPTSHSVTVCTPYNAAGSGAVKSVGNHATHNHTVSVDAHSASSGTASSMPAYLALAFIMRL